MIVLDTHAWVWWNARPEGLSKRARQAIDEAKEVGASPITCWEIAMLVAKGRLTLDRDVLLWVRRALARDRVRLLPLSPAIAVAAANLPRTFQGDPADRLIVATALDAVAPLVTRDRHIRDAGVVEAIW
jgi:PIN domain nuclease of toxin-antitoxin system